MMLPLMPKINRDDAGAINRLARLIDRPQTSDYKPSSFSFSGGAAWAGGWGTFTLADVDRMLEDDQVTLCCAAKKAPVEAAEIHTEPDRNDGILIEAEDGETLAFVEETYKRFWKQGLAHALSMEEYGRSACEAIYRVGEDEDMVEFHALKWIHPRDAEPFVHEGRLAWVQVKNIVRHQGDAPAQDKGRGFVRLMGVNVEEDDNGQVFATEDPQPAKGVWFVRHGHGGSNWYGKSGFIASWWGWRLKTMPDGNVETIFKYGYRHALGPFIGRHPDVMVDGPSGPVFAGDLMRIMLAEIKNGANIIMNNSRDEKGEFQWQIDLSSPPGGQGAAEGLLGIGDWLDRKISRGMEIPDEVLTHDGASGGGYSRAQVGALAFYISREKAANLAIHQFDDQVCKPLVKLNAKLGKLKGSIKYKVTVKSLFPEMEESGPDQGQQTDVSAQPGQPPEPQEQKGPEAIPFSMAGSVYDKVREMLAKRKTKLVPFAG